MSALTDDPEFSYLTDSSNTQRLDTLPEFAIVGPWGSHPFALIPFDRNGVMLSRYLDRDRYDERGEAITPAAPALLFSHPLALRVVVDHLDAYGTDEFPFTLNADLVTTAGAVSSHLLIGSEDCMIGASIPEMLRELADRIEDGEVTA